MGYNLKLNIYRFSLYRIANVIQRQQRGRTVIQYKHDNIAIPFRDFARSLNANVNRDSYLAVVFGALLNYFGNSFRLNTDNTKAVSITPDLPPRPFGTTYKIDGMFKGGETGISRHVYQQGDASNSMATISNSDIPAIHYYYKLWIPYDSDDGILMIQSYTDMGCTSTFKEQMEGFFISYGYKTLWNAMIPTGIMEEYLNRSFINGIRITYGTEPRAGAQGLFASMQLAKKESWLRNLNISFQELLRLPNYQQELQNQLMECINDYNPETDHARVFYTDENKRRANASIGELRDILPSIILPDELKRQGAEVPELDAIATYTDGILERIQRQMGYQVDELV